MNATLAISRELDPQTNFSIHHTLEIEPLEWFHMWDDPSTRRFVASAAADPDDDDWDPIDGLPHTD